MILESALATSLFLLYLLLWKSKSESMKRRHGTSPEVMSLSSSALQRYMDGFSVFLKIFVVIILLAHSSPFRFQGLLDRVGFISYWKIDLLGFYIGLAGLGLCLYAQVKMGQSWRVGLDEKKKTPLVTSGLYGLVRNPTYLGLFLLNAGLFLIWPTFVVFVFNLLFFLFLEIQVRCEEDFLLKLHGEEYSVYKSRTSRYIPFLY